MSDISQLDLSKGKIISDEEKAEAREYIKRFDQKAALRTQWEGTWEECQNYILPRKGSVTSKSTEGERRGEELFDSTAIKANEMLAGALHGILTNGATRFFDLVMVPPDESLNEISEVQDWLQDTADRMFKVLNNTNFQTEIHEIYIDLGAIGTATLFMGEHADRVLHFSARNIKEIFIDEDSEGVVCCVDRKFEWTAAQIIDEFGVENCPDVIIKKFNEGDKTPFGVIHCTYPTLSSDPQYNVFKYKGAYILQEPACILKYTNFPEFPYAVPRWSKTSGEQYGRSPGMDMLPDIKMVNKMMETTLKGAQKTVDPPLMVNDDGVIGRVRLTPGGLTIVRPFSSTGEAPIKPLITDARIDFGEKLIAGIQAQIRTGFYADLFQLPHIDRQTGVEAQIREQDQMRLMGPIVGRQHFELLRVLVERVFGVMNRRRLLLQPPRQLAGKKFGVQYSSLLARAQRSQDAATFMQAISAVSPLVTAKPATLDNLDEDKAFQYFMNLYGIPRKVFRTDQDIQKLRSGRAAAQQQAAQEAQQAHQADVTSKVGPALAQVVTAASQSRQGQ